MGTAVPVLSGHLMCFVLKCCDPMHVEGCWGRAVTEGATLSVLTGWLELRMSGESLWWKEHCELLMIGEKLSLGG